MYQIGDDQLADLGVLQRAVRIQQQRHHAEVLRVVGHRRPVVGRMLLHGVAGGGERDGLTLGEIVGVVGRTAGAEGKGIG